MTWLPIETLCKRLNVPEYEIITRHAVGDIFYSITTDKYELDSLLQQRTMIIGIEKYLNEEEKELLINLMKNYTKLKLKLFKKMQHGEVFVSKGTERIHRIMGKELGLQQIFSDSAMADASGVYKSSQTWKEKYEKALMDSIEEIEKKLRTRKNFKRGLKRTLKRKKEKLEKSLQKEYKSVWFGNKKPAEKEEYEKSRLSVFASGTAGKGNMKFAIVFGTDGYNLKLDNKTIENIKIPSSHKSTFSLTGINRQASRISFNKNGKLVINITYSYLKPIKLTNYQRSKGTIGIDIGPKEIAVCYVKNDGNPLKYQHYNIGGLQDARKEDKIRQLSEILEQILDQGLEFGITHITIEDLSNLRFKKTDNKVLNRMLSKFPKTIFEELITSKCARKGLKLKKVNPAYTSVIGLYKFSNRDNLSFAHTSNSKDLSAALAVGRRGLGIKEREVVCFRKFGRTVSFTASALFQPAEHGRNKGRNRDLNPNFWYRIQLLIKEYEREKETQTGIPKAKWVKPQNSSPAILAEFLETCTNVCRKANVAFDWDAPENQLSF